MSFELETLRELVRAHGRVARVVIAEVRGSAPREPGASMIVWNGGQHGTIGGGALELEATRRARATLENGVGGLERVALGPRLGQCCGGAVTLLTEVFDADRLARIAPPAFVRRVAESGSAAQPLRIRRALARQRNSGAPLAPLLAEGWMLEAVSTPTRQIWIYGAGHVGRAVVGVLAPLPELSITWIDSAENRFPADVPARVRKVVARNPADMVAHAPEAAEHLIFTYSHAIDLEICHRLLGRGFRSAGLIGSRSKWARFRKRLAELGHSRAQIARIACPIGRPELGKHPQAIALGVASDLLAAPARQRRERTEASGR